jgi:hypothetical protein
VKTCFTRVSASTTMPSSRSRRIATLGAPATMPPADTPHRVGSVVAADDDRQDTWDGILDSSRMPFVSTDGDAAAA